MGLVRGWEESQPVLGGVSSSAEDRGRWWSGRLPNRVFLLCLMNIMPKNLFRFGCESASMDQGYAVRVRESWGRASRH